MFKSGVALRSGRKALQCPPALSMCCASSGPSALRSSSTAAAAASSQESATSKNKTRLKPPQVSKSFVQNVFRGIVEPEQAFPYPRVLNEDQTETLQMLLPTLRKTMGELVDPLKFDELETVPKEVMAKMGEMGAFGSTAPVEYGGGGMTHTMSARAAEELGGHDLGTSIMLGAHQSIGYKGIVLSGNDEQKQRYLPRLITGEDIAAFALTEPSSGSDAGSIRSRAELSPDGKHFVLNGSKIWISNGGIAEVFTVFAKTPVTDAETGETKDKVTAFIVERKFGGLTNGPPEKKMGIKASNTAEVFFDNVHIPVDNVLGGVGKGFKVAMEILNNGRFGMGATLAGTMKQIITKASDFAVNRSQFGSKIHTYGAIQEKIARMSMLHYVTESIAYMVSGTMDSGHKDYHLEAAVSKIVGSEAAWFVVDEGIQIMGGMGYMRETGLEKIMRDLRIFRIFEGTNDILRLFIALAGIQYAGGHLQELQKAIKAPIANFGVVLGEVTKRGKSVIGIGRGNVLADFAHPNLSEEASNVCASIDIFGASIEKVLVRHGKDIIHQQFLLGRIAQAAIDIYAQTCVLSRCTMNLNERTPSALHEELMAKTFCSEANLRVLSNLASLRDPIQLKNFDNMKRISDAVCESGRPVQTNPVGF